MKKLFVFAKALAVAMSFLLGIAVAGGGVALRNELAINRFFGIGTQQIVQGEGESAPQDFFGTKYSSVAEVQAGGAQAAEDAVAEGAVLLKNENDALPLPAKAAVSLFSYSSVDPAVRGYGSGAGANDTPALDFRTAFEEEGISVNPALWDWYASNRKYRRDPSDSAMKTVGMLKNIVIGDAPWAEVAENADSFSSYGDAAIFVLARSGGENADMRLGDGKKADMTDGDYLKLSPSEISVLEGLRSLKGSVFSKIVVIMNSASPVQCDFADDPRFGIDAILWVGHIGSAGAAAVAKIVSGAVTPSGRLADTFWKYHYKNPVLANYGSMKYTDMQNSSDESAGYVVYREGIYNGYRYTETWYEDFVTARRNAGEFDYREVVSYPFGYGLSYTAFAHSDFALTAAGSGSRQTFTLSLKVKNTGKRAGKEVVQFYLQKPYTPYDERMNIEKAAVELVGFAKTGMLAPGEEETVTAAVDGERLASYDPYGHKTYILEAGTYYFTAGRDAHAAVNNILAEKGYEGGRMTENGDRDLVEAYHVRDDDFKTYAISRRADGKAAAITNRFEDADLKLYAGAGENADAFEYLTRKDWSGTVRLGYDEHTLPLSNGVVLTRTPQMKEDMAEKLPADDDVDYPVYGSTETDYKLIDLRGVDFDSPLWDDLLDQLTWEETVSLLEQAMRTTMDLASIAKPATLDHNGSVGVCQPFSTGNGYAARYGDPQKGESPAIYPCNGIVASTFNEPLIEAYGEQWGEDCLWAGYNGLYGPSCNLHRSPYCGRSFEYFSEDPILTGDLCCALTEGIVSKGVYVYLKHCVLNDQETNRHGIGTWANEQTIRELYLRPFEICIKRGGAQCVMTGFNRIGAFWTGTHGFCNTVLKDEFGMTGMAISDNPVKSYMTIPYGVLQGNDLPDYSCKGIYRDYEYGHGTLAHAMRESVHRILYTVAGSNAMNGFTATTKVITLTPLWVRLVKGGQIAVYILFGCSMALLAALAFLRLRRRNGKPH